jgi:hypothetical protein
MFHSGFFSLENRQRGAGMTLTAPPIHRWGVTAADIHTAAKEVAATAAAKKTRLAVAAAAATADAEPRDRCDRCGAEDNVGALSPSQARAAPHGRKRAKVTGRGR